MSRIHGVVPRAGWLCAAAGLLNACVWAMLTPPFHVPDETVHVGYVQYLAETGKPPSTPGGPEYSSEEADTLNALSFGAVVFHGRVRAAGSDDAEPAPRAVSAPSSRRSDGGGLSGASKEPPLYYGLQALPYFAGSGGSLLARLTLMRLLSALVSALTVLLVFVFLRELLPGTPYAWSAGALAVAFQPLFGFMSSGVTPDALLFCAAAGLFLALTGAWRRGLSPAWAAAIGLAVAIGLGTKLAFVGMIPGALLLATLLLVRVARRDRRVAKRSLLAMAVPVLLGAVVYAVLNVAVWNRGVLGEALTGTVSASAPGPGGVALPGSGGNLKLLAAYIWQLYLPRLPFMFDWFAGNPPIYNVWLVGFTGTFGWLDYGFPRWVANVLGVVLLLLLLVTVETLARGRRRLGRTWPLLAGFLAILAGVLLEIGVVGERFTLRTGQSFPQARYLLPLLPLYAALVAVAVRRGGRRFELAIASAFVVLAFAHGLFAQLLTVARYYV